MKTTDYSYNRIERFTKDDLPFVQRARDHEYATYLLIPAEAEQYLYDYWDVTAEIMSTDDWWWGDHLIGGKWSRDHSWVVATVSADSVADLVHLVNYQRDRLFSGAYGSWLWAPGYGKDGE